MGFAANDIFDYQRIAAGCIALSGVYGVADAKLAIVTTRSQYLYVLLMALYCKRLEYAFDGIKVKHFSPNPGLSRGVTAHVERICTEFADQGIKQPLAVPSGDADGWPCNRGYLCTW